MVRTILIFGLALSVPGGSGAYVGRQAPPNPPSAAGQGATAVDGIAARIEEDILTESEVRELAAFQTLVDGHAKPRSEIIEELANQWIVQGEASAAKYPKPSREDVDRSFAQLTKQFASPEDFKNHYAQSGLTEAGIRRMLEQQIYLSRFLDYRFRPAAQVNDQQVQEYYNNEFAPQLKGRGEVVPALEDVEDTIREVLVQRAINDRATTWLDETRNRLKIDVTSPGANP
jgi:hypothetical protein